GEAGRGFAVVAEEIRNLADRSAKATSEVAAIIRGLQGVVQEAVATAAEGQRVAQDSGRLSEDGLAGLRRILDGVHQSAGKVAEIAQVTEEQLSAGENLVTVISKTAQQARQVSS